MKPGTGTKGGGSARAVQQHMQEETVQAVLGEMRQAHELAALAGRGGHEMQADLERWKAEGRIFSVEHDGVEYFPAFVLDPAAGYSPYPAVAATISIFAQTGLSRWALPAWFIGLNSFLDDQRPMDLLAFDPDWLIEAARDELREMGVSVADESRTASKEQNRNEP